jgi:chorismate dehydratase
MEKVAKIKVGAVSYLNTIPMIYGIESGVLKEQIELVLDYPSRLAGMLHAGELDLGLIPVAMIPSIPGAQIISNYCIATDGEVASVCIFSNVPLEDVSRLLLDYQSRSSVALTKILLQHHWKINPDLVDASPGFEEQLGDKEAALIIGDRALANRGKYNFIYDLGLAWKAMTGLPFVFAAWVTNKHIDPAFISMFNDQISQNLLHIDDIVGEVSNEHYDMDKYYKQHISYQLDDEKRKGLGLFLQYISDSNQV